MKLRIRHLPPASTLDTVKQMLEENIGEQAIKADRIQLISVSVGKPASSTKQQVCATAYVQVPNEQVAWKLLKKLQPINLLVDIAPQQALPSKKTCSNVNSPQAQMAGTWKQDEEYLKYEAAQKPASKPEFSANPPPPPPVEREIPPLVAHMMKELALQRKAKTKQAKKTGSSVTPAGTANATTTPTASKPPKKQQQRSKRSNKPPPPPSSS